MYKLFKKTSKNTYDDIARQAFGTPEKAGEIAKLNNNVAEGDVIVFFNEETNKEDEVKQVCVQIDDILYKDFAQYTLIDNLNGVKGAVFCFNQTDIDYPFKMGQECIVYDENGIFFKGRVSIIDANLDGRANWVQIEIKSHAGDLLDSDIPYPNGFNNSSTRNILQQVAAYYSQEITFSDEKELDEVFINEIGTSFSAANEEKAFSFMNRICQSRGLLLTDTGEGLFVGRYNPQTQEKLNLIDGECLGLKKIRFIFNGDNLGRYYELNSQYPATATHTTQIPFPIPLIKRLNSNDYNSSDLSSLGSRMACQEIGKAIKLVAVLSENINIKSGAFATVKNKKIKIYDETDFVIERVERKHPDETILTMTLPCAYTYIIPDSLPLC